MPANRLMTGPTDISAMMGAMRGIRNFTAIPEEIQAIQFTDWNSATDIFSFADGFMFVGRGYEHKLRKPEEFNQIEGNVLLDAPEFLVFKAESGEYRIDVGFWVVRKSNGDVVIYSDEQIKTHFNENQF